MKCLDRVWVGSVLAGVLLAVPALTQMAGGDMGGGPGAGMGQHRPPMERAFGAQGGLGRWWNNPRMIEQLKLTDEQRKAFDGILLDHREKLIDLHASLQKAELSLEPLMRDDQPNEAKILAQIDKVAQARAELEKVNARFLLAIRGKLTPEQWKQVQAFRANRMHERHSIEEGGPGRGGLNHRFAPPPPPLGAGPDAPPAPGAGSEM